MPSTSTAEDFINHSGPLTESAPTSSAMPINSESEPSTPQLTSDDDDDDNDVKNDNKAEVTLENGDSSDASPMSPLYKSRRFKGYLTIFLASIINFNAAILSDEPIDRFTVPATQTQQAYAKGVALMSAIITGLLVLIHLDRYSPLESKLWRPAFQPQSKFETVIIAFLLLWWFIATIIQTSVRGIAGDGRQQYNLYYSTWVCCWTSIWIAERKLVDFGYPTFRTFVMSWPYRAPGWIAVFILCFFTLWWYIDLFNNTKANPDRIPQQLANFYEPIPRSQYQWLIFVAAFTLLPSAIFIIVEILRGAEEESLQQQTTTSRTSNVTANNTKLDAESNNSIVIGQQSKSRQPQKKSGEIILEGFCLLCLALSWIPSVIAATIPGGFASPVGNAYFFTWATTAFVLETCLWFIHDWRKSVHKALEEKELEYHRHQQEVLEMTMHKIHEEEQRTPIEDDDTDNSQDHYGDEDASYERDDEDEADDNFSAPSRLETIHVQGDEYSDFGHDGDCDDDAMRELRLKQANETAYFDTLDDILE